ncbi:tetratricopeptide repeat protein [Flavobacterium sp. Sd200]|uniref:tetratricopeptide repeat protein n=1 Tax=Flavobacterium sp. Sd200 TaxID=2692211 RepID=UPI001F43366B|nr:tetratricopeptide repeat protein [Flavobacterium sp. Sd200]
MLFFVAFSYAQQQPISLPPGDWVVVNTELKDGSKILEPTIEDSDYKEYRITKKEICIVYDAIHRNANDKSSCVSYNALPNNVIRTSALKFYTIEKATKDTLVLTDKNGKVSNDKIRRFTMIRRDALVEKEKQKSNGQTIVTASKYFSPACSIWLEEELYRALKKNLKEFAVIGKIVFHPKLKTMETVVTSSKSHDAETAATIKRVLDKSYKNWNLDQFAAYDAVELPFVLMSRDNYFYHSIRFYYFTNDISAVRLKQGGSMFDKGLAKVAFDEGLKAILNKDYKEAIELFEYAYQLDPMNIDAIYNKAAMLYKSGDVENACLTWKEIASMGQAEAETMCKTYCNK